jgi:hypothetical protein
MHVDLQRFDCPAPDFGHHFNRGEAMSGKKIGIPIDIVLRFAVGEFHFPSGERRGNPQDAVASAPTVPMVR